VIWLWCVGADDRYVIRISDEYEVDAGGTYGFNRQDKGVLVPSAEIRRQLTIIVRLFESDQGISREENKRYRTPMSSSDVTDAFDKSVPNYGVVIEVGDAYSKMLEPLTDGNDDDNNYLGERRQLWSALDLMKKTSNKDQSFTEELLFTNGDSDGSFALEYEVIRVNR
jgi:hypothetical protein